MAYSPDDFDPPFVNPVSGSIGGGYHDKRLHGSHLGGDLYAEPGSSVVAPGNMEILYGKRGGTNLRDNDYWVHAKDIDTGVEYRFAHTGDISHLKPGQRFNKGEPFATIGAVVDKPHLHMSIVDPNTGKHIDWLGAAGLARGQNIVAGTPIGQTRDEIKASKISARTHTALNVDDFDPPEGINVNQFDSPAATQQVEPQQPVAPSLPGGGLAPKSAPLPELNPFQASPEAQVLAQPESIFDAKGAARSSMPWIRPSLQYGGLTAGGAFGAGSGLLTAGTTSYPGAVVGGTLGYGMGSRLANAIDEWAGGKKPETISEIPINVAGELKRGLVDSMAGEIGGPVLQGALKLGGKIAKPVLGRMGGTGTKNIEEALNSETLFSTKTEFDKAIRGETSGNDIVNNFLDAARKVHDKMGETYRSKLTEIRLDPRILDNVKLNLNKETSNALSPENFSVILTRDPNNKLGVDYSNSVIVESQPVVTRALEDIVNWKDLSVKGLDELKKRLSTYVKQAKTGSPAEALLTRLTKNLADGLKNDVPQYASMSKDYHETSKMLEEIEKTLALKTNRGNAQYTADQILRRLTSSMRDNFSLRGDMVDVLGSKAASDLSGQIAGYNMRSVMPHGLSGSIALGEVGAGALFHKLVNPAFWVIIAASSPRVQGEFLKVYGQGLKATTGQSLPVGKIMSYLASEKLQNSGKAKEE